jgi:hypothetical protein
VLGTKSFDLAEDLSMPSIEFDDPVEVLYSPTTVIRAANCIRILPEKAEIDHTS